MDVFKVTYNDPRIETAFEEGYAQGGYVGAMKGAAEALVCRLPEAFTSPFDIATCYAVAGEKDKAIEWLEKGFEARDPNMPYIGVMPCFDGIRSDPHLELLRKMRLPSDDNKGGGGTAAGSEAPAPSRRTGRFRCAPAAV